MDYRVDLDAFHGPLDLLLYLVKKNEVDIFDIPIAKIAEQFQEYLRVLHVADVERAGDFLVMAATLMEIKSKLLLPRDPELDKISPEEDPRKELVERLIEHERFKNAAEMLQQKRVVEEAMWSNPQIELFIAEDEAPSLAVTIFDLVRTFQSVLERAKNRPVYEIGNEDVSIPDMIQFLRNQLRRSHREPLSATRLFERQRSRRAMICLFLAILELVKRQGVELTQGEAFGDIGIRKGPGFENSDAGLEDLVVLEQEYR